MRVDKIINTGGGGCSQTHDEQTSNHSGGWATIVLIVCTVENPQEKTIFREKKDGHTHTHILLKNKQWCWTRSLISGDKSESKWKPKPSTSSVRSLGRSMRGRRGGVVIVAGGVSWFRSRSLCRWTSPFFFFFKRRRFAPQMAAGFEYPHWCGSFSLSTRLWWLIIIVVGVEKRVNVTLKMLRMFISYPEVRVNGEGGGQLLAAARGRAMPSLCCIMGMKALKRNWGRNHFGYYGHWWGNKKQKKTLRQISHHTEMSPRNIHKAKKYI